MVPGAGKVSISIKFCKVSAGYVCGAINCLDTTNISKAERGIKVTDIIEISGRNHAVHYKLIKTEPGQEPDDRAIIKRGGVGFSGLCVRGDPVIGNVACAERIRNSACIFF